MNVLKVGVYDVFEPGLTALIRLGSAHSSVHQCVVEVRSPTTSQGQRSPIPHRRPHSRLALTLSRTLVQNHHEPVRSALQCPTPSGHVLDTGPGRHGSRRESAATIGL